ARTTNPLARRWQTAPDAEIGAHKARAARHIDIGRRRDCKDASLLKTGCKSPNGVCCDDHVRVNVNPWKAASNLVAKIQGVDFACNVGLNDANGRSEAPGGGCGTVRAAVANYDHVQFLLRKTRRNGAKDSGNPRTLIVRW